MSQNPDPFIANPPATPLIDKAAETVGKGLDYMMNDVIIGGLGRMGDSVTAMVKDFNPGGINVGGKAGELSGGAGLSPSMGKSPDAPSAGRSPELVKSPDVPEKVKSLGRESVAGGGHEVKVAEVNNQELGNLAPMTRSAGIQTHSQGMSIG